MDNFKDIQKACSDLAKYNERFKEQTKGLKQLIEKSYISQSKIARKMGYSPQAFCRKLKANTFDLDQVLEILAFVKKFKTDPFE